MLTSHVIENVAVEGITRHADRLIADNPRKGDYRDIGSTPADINNHVTDGLFNIDTCSDGRSDRFIDHVNFFCSGVFGRVAYGTLLYLGDPRRNTDHHP